jgi:AcrR family transcriptional regulator
MDKKKRTKQRIRNPAQTRAKLLQATIALLAEKGPDALSVKEAARIANVSRGVAYQHFEDRDHLLREAKTWISDRLSEFAVALDPASLEEQVKQVARLVLNNREASKLLVADALAGGGLAAEHPLYKLVTQMLEDFKAGGDARSDIDVEVLSFIMLGTVATIIMLSRLGKEGNVDSLAERFTAEWTRILRHGIFAEGKSRPTGSSRGAPKLHVPSKATVRR